MDNSGYSLLYIISYTTHIPQTLLLLLYYYTSSLISTLGFVDHMHAVENENNQKIGGTHRFPLSSLYKQTQYCTRKIKLYIRTFECLLTCNSSLDDVSSGFFVSSREMSVRDENVDENLLPIIRQFFQQCRDSNTSMLILD